MEGCIHGGWSPAISPTRCDRSFAHARPPAQPGPDAGHSQLTAPTGAPHPSRPDPARDPPVQVKQMDRLDLHQPSTLVFCFFFFPPFWNERQSLTRSSRVSGEGGRVADGQLAALRSPRQQLRARLGCSPSHLCFSSIFLFLSSTASSTRLASAPSAIIVIFWTLRVANEQQ